MWKDLYAIKLWFKGYCFKGWESFDDIEGHYVNIYDSPVLKSPSTHDHPDEHQDCLSVIA